MKQRVLGIDVGSYSVKIAEMERSLRSFELIGFYEQPVVQREKPEEGAAAPQTLALQRLFEEYNLSGDFIYSALPGEMVAFRNIDLPFSNFKKIDTTIEFEMENYLPLPLEEIAVDYEILESSKTDSKVLVSYTRKGELIKFLNLFAPADLDPRFIGAEPVEIASLVRMGAIASEGIYALLDLGHEKTNIILFEGKKLKSARTVMIGGKNLTRAISEALKIPYDEAEKIKIEMGQVGETVEGADTMTRQVFEALQGPLQELTIQIKQTLLAFQEMAGEVVQALWLTGGTSRLAGIDQYFSKTLRKNISFFEGVDLMPHHLTDTAWFRPIGSTAVALAYRGVEGVRNRNIQFRRGEFAYKGEVKDLVHLVREVGIQIGIIGMVALITFLLSYASLKGKIRSQGKALAQVAAEILPELPQKSLTNPKNVLSILGGRINEMQEKKRKINEELSLSILDILNEISSKLPPGEKLKVDIDSFTLAAGRIRLSGKTNSFEAVDQVKSALSQSTKFKEVATENVRKGVGDEVKFDISMALKGEENGA